MTWKNGEHNLSLEPLRVKPLFRTEFLFLGAHDPPNEAAQAGLYRQVVSACTGDPVTIRTLDLGGDKVPAFLVPHVDRNPSLGLRRLRFSLDGA